MTGGAGAAGPLLRTPLFDEHRALEAHLVPFNGWEMPLYYRRTGILEEHRAVREAVGMFDVSHMGILSLEGPGAAALLARRTPTNALVTPAGRCRYTFFLDDEGKILDDLIFTRLDEGAAPEGFLFVPNAGTAPRIYEVLRQHRPEGCEIERHNGKAAILAVQGPRSREVLQMSYGWDLGLKPYTGGFYTFGERDGRHFGTGFAQRVLGGREAFVSRTGYTGELGFEVFLSAARAREVWETLARAGVVPCGLGARDSLRLEKGFLLSGVDFHRDRTPLEAGQEKFLEFDHPFVGRAALEKQRQGPFDRWTGLLCEDPEAIPRHGTPIRHAGSVAASVSSGGRSPTLHRGIALAYLPSPLQASGTPVELDVRGRPAKAQVVPLPFVPQTASPRAAP